MVQLSYEQFRGFVMNKTKIIFLIACILIVFSIINFIARGFCTPSENSRLGTFLEKNIPKPSSEDIDELRRIWATLFMKYCGQASNQKF
jgi:hypothetical protein